TSVEGWWTKMSSQSKGLDSMTMLMSWEIWNEKNARIFRGHSTLPTFMLAKIKLNDANWVTAGAKRLGSWMSRE
ncbi:hypothetical protein BRADI_1g60554v3, partial [Brachypodium distachyon]